MILSTLLQSRPKVLVLSHPSPGSQSGIGLMDTSNDELHGHDLFQRDHSQLLCGEGDSSELPTTGMPPLEPMDTLLAPTSENLLATAGVDRGGKGQSQPRAPATPGIRQIQPTAPHQQMPTPGGQETRQVTPYQQQVYPPRRATGVRKATTKTSTAPTTSQGQDAEAREGEDARVGPHPKDLKANTGDIDPPPEDPGNAGEASMTSGWKRDLTHIIGCCWAAQVGPLDSEEWDVALHKFLAVMRNRRAVEWTDIKELSPLRFMPYQRTLRGA